MPTLIYGKTRLYLLYLPLAKLDWDFHHGMQGNAKKSLQ